MLVKLKMSASGDRIDLRFGQEIELDELKRLIGAGYEAFYDGGEVAVVAPEEVPEITVIESTVVPKFETPEKFKRNNRR